LGTRKETKLIILAALFLVTTLLVHGNKEQASVHGKPLLKDYFQDIPGYEPLRTIDLKDNAIDMLKLDDYAFLDYMTRERKVNLYIGYYYTANKAYASHSPLICYPSQGWEIADKPAKRTLSVGPHTVNYELITTSYGEQKELVFYWYQTHGRTSTQVYQNKIDMAYNKLMKKNEQHAFVRISVPFADSTLEEAEKSGTDFIRVFFPKFLEYFAETQP